MSKRIEDVVVLNSDDILVEELDDYYGSASSGSELNTTIVVDLNYRVGVVHAVGSNLSKEWIGKIIYYTAKMGTEVNIKGYGTYLVINDRLKQMVRLDQNINNYK